MLCSENKIPKPLLKKTVSASTPLLSLFRQKSPRKQAGTFFKKFKTKSTCEPTPKSEPLSKQLEEDILTPQISIGDIKSRYWQAQQEIAEQQKTK